MAEDEENTAPDAAKKGPWQTIIIVAALTLIAVWLVPGEESLNSNDQTNKAETINSSTEPSLSKKNTSAGSEARTLIETIRATQPFDLDLAFKSAQGFQQANKITDAYLLYFFAAREGHGLAAFSLAQQADSSVVTKNNVFEAPDDARSNKWYGKAINAGITEADAARGKLRARVETLASNGDLQAQRMMLQWK